MYNNTIQSALMQFTNGTDPANFTMQARAAAMNETQQFLQDIYRAVDQSGAAEVWKNYLNETEKATGRPIAG